MPTSVASTRGSLRHSLDRRRSHSVLECPLSEAWCENRGMSSVATPWWAWFLGFPLSAPWVILAIWYWRTTPRHRDDVPASFGELARRRLTGGR